ncbi:ATP-binding cassette domain-containing protein [Paenibacillus tengchongensis]|uniref:ATP-binding cassette domain-containing protein n=1 Tax=Paenibacillus tengchongensis TaxID=2608684 RepID=UPI00124DF70A|nr:ATP-binding cassette domain-containing protein [Paenibacillus tengchongensis]
MNNLFMWIKRQFFYTEVNSVIKASSERMLRLEDLAPLETKDREGGFNNLSYGSVGKFIGSMIRINRKPTVWGIFFTLFRVFFALSIPVLIKQILTVIVGDGVHQSSISDGVIKALLFAIATIISGIVTNQCFFWDFVAFQKHQKLLNSLIFRQMLKLNTVARSKYRSGDVINSVGNDVQTISNLGYLVNDLFYVIILFIGVIVLLLYYLGLGTLSAVATLLVFQPIALRITKHFVKFDNNRARLRESRLNLISQLLSGIRTVKLYDLTGLLDKKIRDVRDQEVQQQISWGSKSAMSIVVFGSTTTLVCLAAFGTRVMLNQPLDPTVLFPSLGLLMLLEVPFAQMPDILNNFSGVKAAGQRVLNFLKADQNPSGSKPLSAPGVAVGVSLEQVSMAVEDQETPILSGINLTVKPGESVAIVGSVGSGKSVLLRSLLEKDERVSGLIRWEGVSSSQTPRTVYVPQEAFIFNATLKENILMGLEEAGSEELLKRAIEVTAMEADVRLLTGGLAMEIGERGIGLSGGQKQRVSLARSVMAQPGLALLDDPFSALDSATEEQIVERLLFTEWKPITRIVATHRLRFLHRFDKIVYLQEGKIIAQGTLDELLTRPDFRDFYSDAPVNTPITPAAKESEAANEILSQEADSNDPLRITEDEDRRSGSVGRKVYGAFVNAMTGGKNNPKRRYMSIALAATVVLAVLIPLIQNLWFVALSDPQAFREGSLLRRIAENSGLSILIYAGIGVLIMIVTYMQRALWNRQTAVASGILHNEGLEGVVRAPIRFFDSTMSGVLMNRFSRDVFVIENDLRWMFENMVRFTFQCIVNMILIVIAGPWLIFGIVPILWAYYKLQKKFSIASREIKRLVQVKQSPLFSHLRETFEGLLTIRTFNQSDYFTERFEERHNAFQRASRAHELTDRWFSVRVPVLSGGISMISAVSIFFAARHGLISTGLAGVILTYLISFWTLLNWSARTFAMVEGNLTSVERLMDLAQLPNEETSFRRHDTQEQAMYSKYIAGTNDIEGMTSFERKGASIEFVAASVRYAEHLPDVLKNLSFSIAPGAQVGIIGRTGSGKSTILQSLVGMAEVSSGDILIDGVPIRAIPLRTLRSLVAVVPQEPFLLNGELRMNLDPNGLHPDERLREVMDQVGMGDFMRLLPEGLDTVISESGGNLSQGQRQLICFARALLKYPRIIIMDEATSNVDVQTEARIQSQLKAAIDGITVLTIAHRTSTVLGCDQIIRLSAGRLENTSTEDGDMNE